MFNQNGLSLDQAPPISVVFRFFFSGALFGILAAILILCFGSTIFDASTTQALILTHTLTLGVMLSFMFAALFQMLPVIAGVTLKAPIQKANRLQYPFVFGVVTLLFAFYTSLPWLFMVASILLGGSILYIVILMLTQLFKITHHSSSSKGMMLSLLSLGTLLLLALYLTASLSGLSEGSYYTSIKTAHFSLGLFGWISLLILSISFQVIEMFYVTPAYPKAISHYLPLGLFSILLSSTIVGVWIPSIWSITTPLLFLLLAIHALTTLKRLTQRKRPLTDATVWFWRLGMGLLLASLTLQIGDNSPLLSSLSYLCFAGFALSIVFAMFYKIVPFLTWFHLNSQGYFTAPMMHEVIHPKTAMKHLYIHLATLVTFGLSLIMAPLIYVASLLTLLSFGWMLFQIIHAWKLYVHTQTTGEKFNMGDLG